MDYSFVIRRAVPEDAPAVHEILLDAFMHYQRASHITGPVDALQETVGDIEDDIRNKHVFIALIDSLPVGTMRVAIRQEDRVAYISRLGVKAAYANQGIGKSMMNLVDKLLMEHHVSRVFLHAAARNGDLIRFYYGRGFYVESTSLDRGYTRALMVKDLPEPKPVFGFVSEEEGDDR
ncbi:MAG TPA: N-acetyltransferase [Clostridiales bacterium]|nr:N-acetyltransferase [Clostridiales bacterium]